MIKQNIWSSNEKELNYGDISVIGLIATLQNDKAFILNQRKNQRKTLITIEIRTTFCNDWIRLVTFLYVG